MVFHKYQVRRLRDGAYDIVRHDDEERQTVCVSPEYSAYSIAFDKCEQLNQGLTHEPLRKDRQFRVA